jgi:aminopeptidase N
LYVKPECPGEEIELKILYEGQPRQDSEDYIRQEEIILRTDGNWLPVLPFTMADFDVTIRHPSSYTFFGQGRKVKQGRVEGGWTESRWRLEKSMGFTLYGGPRYKTKETRVGSVDIIVALWPEDIEILESVSQRATDIMKRITGHLGNYPLPTLRIVESGRNDGRSGYGPVSNISIGYRMLREGIDDAMLSHEIAHGWWGGLVPLARESLFRGQWNETLAEYTSVWGLEKDEAEALQRKWSDGYASLESEKDKPLLEVGSYSAHWKLNEAITYHKGALIMQELDVLIGLDSMKDALAVFSEERKGKASSWDNICEAFEGVCGAKVSRWLREKIST